MDEKTEHEELKIEIEHEHFARAALIAASLGLPEAEIKDLRCKALWQMSAIYRNALGTKILAQQYGFSKEEVRQILEQHAEKSRNRGNSKALEPCYDYSTGKYLSFEEWMDHSLLKNWSRLS